MEYGFLARRDPRRDCAPKREGTRRDQTDASQPRSRTSTRPARAGHATGPAEVDLAPPTLVDGDQFNGYVSAMDRATCKPIRPLLISTHATRDAFSEIRLDEPELDPVLCLRGYLNAVVSPHPYDLEPVRPVVQFDLSKYKFVEEMQIAAGLDSRPDLLALKPVEFEHLIREQLN